jgi:hypothetical protein
MNLSGSLCPDGTCKNRNGGTPLDVVAIKIGAGEALVGDAGIDRFVDKCTSGNPAAFGGLSVADALGVYAIDTDSGPEPILSDLDGYVDALLWGGQFGWRSL